MPSATLEGLTLHVENVERSLEFYSKIPGATVEARSLPHFAMLRIGTARLGLLGYNQQQREWGERDFLVNDPDGNLVEFGVAHS